MKKIYLFILLVISSVSFAQYSGTGTFTKIDSISELSDGYYVITNETNSFLMTSNRSGNETTGFFVSEAVTITDNTITNPVAINVWKIESSVTGKTIYSESITKYIGWSSGNSASIEDTITDTSTWTITHTDNKFTINNVATPARQLSYNATSPRFAAYGNTNQQELQLYKLEESVNIPIITTSTNVIPNLTYVEGSGPSIALDFGISGTNLNGSNVTITAPENFLVSTDGVLFDQFITLENYDGSSETILVILASELLEGNYNGNITITGGGIVTPLTIAVSGSVSELILNPEITINETEIIDLNYNANEGPSVSQFFNIAGNQLNGTNVTIVATANFEVSLDNTAFFQQVTLTEFAGESTPIHVRLATNLPVNTYTGTLTINGGGIPTPLIISLTGEVDSTASIKDNNIEGLKVYPNPATDLVNIVSNEIGTKTVAIYDMLGKKVLETSTEETVNVSILTSGVYIMNITQDGRKASRKLVIK